MSAHFRHSTQIKTVAIPIAPGICMPAAAEQENASALLLAKTQAFSDAGQRGDADVLKALLDDKVIFFNENGDASSKDDIVTGAAPSPASADVKMVVRCIAAG